ncbi:MAG: sensor histidine kinase [Paraburkholderia fungorum]
MLAEEVEELHAIHPDKRIELDVIGDSQGVWDGQRPQQLLGNLVRNAIRYGARDAPVRVVVTCDVTQIRIEVRNSGPAIARTSLAHNFDPLARSGEHEDKSDASNLGLGLYIANEIAKAHHGEIEARFDGTETAFSVLLPRAGDL